MRIWKLTETQQQHLIKQSLKTLVDDYRYSILFLSYHTFILLIMSYSFFSAKSKAPVVNLISLSNDILNMLISDHYQLSHFVLEILRFDVSLMISILTLIVMITTVINYSYQYLYALTLNHLMMFILFNLHDNTYQWMIFWLSEHQIEQHSYSLRIKSEWYQA